MDSRFLRGNNIVRDYNKLQGTTHPADLSYQIIRDINSRYITVENSSNRPIGVAIVEYGSGPTPPIRFALNGGEIRHLGINSHGTAAQFIWIIDIDSKKIVGVPSLIRSNSNELVLRDGLNKWFVDFYRRPSYNAAK